jgi:hypothetical protein
MELRFRPYIVFRTFPRNKLVHDCVHSYVEVVLILKSTPKSQRTFWKDRRMRSAAK